MSIFRSILHDIYIQLNNKLALSPEDDKRFLVPEALRGHKLISNKLQVILQNDDDDEIEN